MSKRIGLVTDSTCDIPAEWREQYHIEIVPLTVIFGSKQYLDGVEMTASQFYDRLPQDSTHPSTSQPSPQAFAEAFDRAAARGADEILAITISSALSGTVESARQAAAEFSIPVHVMDSRNTSMGLGWQVMAAARVQESGGSLEDMIKAVEYTRQNMAFYVSLDTMEYLARGGRMSDAARFLDSVLHIKPLIYVNPETGSVGASLPSRSRKSAVQTLYREFFRHISSGQNQHVAVLHTQALDEAQTLAERLQNEHPGCEMIVGFGAPVLGVHVGLKALALCGYAD